MRGPILAISAVYAFAVVASEKPGKSMRFARSLSPIAAGWRALVSWPARAGRVFGRSGARFVGQSQRDVASQRAMHRALKESMPVLAAALDRLIQEDRLYRDERLSVSSLALKLKLPEHRLRRLINQQLGHRNFNAFVNRWRLAEAKAALADPAQLATPISTIALDAGFGSLGPFNRAFKADTGLTPTEYRAQAAHAGVEIAASAGNATP